MNNQDKKWFDSLSGKKEQPEKVIRLENYLVETGLNEILRICRTQIPKDNKNDDNLG